MPAEIGPEPTPAGVHVSIAPFLDFHFALYLLARHNVQPERWVPPWIVEVERDNRELVASATAFWPEAGLATLASGEPYREWGELMVAAWSAGALLGPLPGAAIAAVDASLAAGFPPPPLPSEPPAVVALVARRIAVLQSDAGLRQRYISLLAALWDAVEPFWQRDGIRDATATAATLQDRLRSETDLRRLVPGNTFVHRDAYQSQISAARERGELHIIPLGLGGEGQLFWSLPGIVLVGSGSAVGEKLARRRQRAETASTRFKVLSDPTRLAILAELLHADSHYATTVTELASLFGLSQPTVSVHMKMLREAGLLTSRREGNHVSYKAAEDTLRDYVGGALADVLSRGQHATGPDGPVEFSDC